MTYIGEVLGWKFNHRPGMTTMGGEIVEWPAGEDLPTPEELAQWTAEYELWRARQVKRAAIEARLEAALEAGLEYGGKVLQIREGDQQNIIAMSQRAALAQAGVVSWSAEFAWRMADNTFLPVATPAEMIALATAAANEVYRLRLVAWTHKDAIAALTTVEAVEAHDIEQGWDSE